MEAIQSMISPPVQAVENESPQAQKAAVKKTKPGSKVEESDFAGVMSQTAQASQVQISPAATAAAGSAIPTGAQMVPGAQVVTGSPVTNANAAQNSANNTSAQSSAKRMNGREVASTGEKIAVSTNTASAMTGLNPWSKDWVFRPDEAMSPQKASLLGSQSSAGDPNTELMQQLQQMAQGSPQASAGRQKVATKLGASQTQASQQPQSAEALIAQLRQQSQNGGESMATAVLGQGVPQTSNVRGQKISRGQAQGATGSAELAALTAAQSGKENWGEYQIESLTADGGEAGAMNLGSHGAKSASKAASKAGASSMALSGSEFLDTLRSAQSSQPSHLKLDSVTDAQSLSAQNPNMTRLSQGRRFQELPEQMNAVDLSAGAAGMTQLYPRNISQNQDSLKLGMPVVAGHVTQGAGTRERFTSEGLTNVTNGIRDLQGSGGGEMKIRLKPDHLGELMLRVKTQGKDVGIQIHASDEGAKKVIEESLSYLKESLSSQNLNLARVDVALTPPVQEGLNLRNDSSSQQQQSQANMNRDYSQSNAQNGREYEEAPGTVRPLASNVRGSDSSSSSNLGSNRRLDVRA